MTGQSIPNVCPRCANGRPCCADRKPSGERYSHAETCATYQWAADVCARCKVEMIAEGQS